MSCIDLSKILLFFRMWLKQRTDLIVWSIHFIGLLPFVIHLWLYTTWMRRYECFWILLHFYCIQINSKLFDTAKKNGFFRWSWTFVQCLCRLFCWFSIGLFTFRRFFRFNFAVVCFDCMFLCLCVSLFNSWNVQPVRLRVARCAHACSSHWFIESGWNKQNI